MSDISSKLFSNLPAAITIAGLLVIGGVAHYIGTDSTQYRSPIIQDNASAAENVTTTASTSTTQTTTTTTVTTTPSSTTSSTTEAPETTAEAPAEPVNTETTPAAEPQEPAAVQEPVQKPVYNYDYLSAGTSPNSSYYQDRIVIIGDSIAYGFNAYGYVPFEHNLAKESVSMWNLNAFTFDKGWGAMNIVDNTAYVKPALIYMSMGLNDVNATSSARFAETYRSTIDQILNNVPDTTIVVGAITPISASNTFIGNDVIREFNSALENMVGEINSPQVMYFDAYSLLADPDTLALRWDFSSGDGMHLGSQCYNMIFTALFNYLDTTSAMDQIHAHDGY